jgi:tetratricopeptide (TPR) repeat protein
MQFSLDGSEWMRSRGERPLAAGSSDIDARRERTPLAALDADALSAGLAANAVGAPLASERLIAYSVLLQDIARRSGRIETLARAAGAARRARREARADKTLLARAMLEQAMVLRLGSVLFGDEDATIECAGVLDLIEGLAPCALVMARVKAVRATLAGSAALAWNDARRAKEAAQSLHAAADVLARLGAGEREVADVRLERADLLIALGERNHDREPLEEAEAELHRLTRDIDPATLPVTWGRAETLRGKALAALGEATGDPAAIAEAVAALADAVAEIPAGLSPLDAARAGHALGLALQAMGEACDEEALFDRAVNAFSPALEALQLVPALPFRAIAAHDGAACLARRAERRGDLKALEQAELVFRDALKARTAAADPLAWAVTQVALARIYEAQSLLRRDTGERADAAFALAAALEVFTERGMRSLSDGALSALKRVRQLA